MTDAATTHDEAARRAGPESWPASRGRPLVTMVVRNGVTHDARVLREASLLRQSGYDVVVFGISRDGLPAEEERGGVRIVRLKPAGVLQKALDAPIRGPRYAERLWLRATRKRRIAVARLGGFLSGRRLGPGFEPEGGRRPVGARALHAVWIQARRRLRRPRIWAASWTFIRQAGASMAALRPFAYHCHDFNTLWAGRIAKRRWRAPLVYDSHEVAAHQNVGYDSKTRRKFIETVERIALRRVDLVITVSESIAAHLTRRYRIARPTVVRNVPVPPKDAAGVEVPAELSGPRVKVLYLGGIMLGRGIEETIAAMQGVPDADLVLMGPVVRSQYPDHFRRIAAEHGVGERLIILPPVGPEEVFALSKHATVGVALPRNVTLNNYYSLPNKLFEYLQAGLPVVVSDFPELRTVVAGNDCGRTCDPEDPTSIAKAILSIVSDPEELERLRRNALKAAAQYTWPSEGRRLLAAYEGLAAGAER